jgi:arylsulfatase A-like enzyme
MIPKLIKNLKIALLMTAIVLILSGCKSIYSAEEPAPTSSQPNIIFILVDDMGLGDLGSYGGALEPTPNIDRLAAEGTRFTDFYTVSPICSASRVGFTTGMFPARWQITSFLQKRAGNRKSEQTDYLAPEAPSIARMLKSAGYATGHFGKWHMGGGRDVDDAPKLSAYGFDESISTWESPDPDPAITATDWIWSPKDPVKRWDRTTYFVDKTLDFMARHKNQPMYIQLWPDDVHTPWVPEEVAEGQEEVSMRKSAQNLRPVIRILDQQIGRLVRGVQELGLGEETLIIFSSDNGPLPSFDGQRTMGLRGSKLSLYEGGLRMPFIAWWPGTVPAGEVDQQTFFTAVDLFPSLAALAGAPLPDKHLLDGQDLSAALLARDASHEGPVFWEYGRNDTVFNYPPAPDRSPNLAVREGKWKLLVNDDGTDVELYNLAEDPNETRNLASKSIDVTQRLLTQVLQWRQSLP